MEKAFMTKHWFRYIKRYEEIRKLYNSTRWRFYYWFLLGYDYIKNHCRLGSVGLKRIRYWPKRNSTNRIHGTIEKCRQCNCCQRINVCINFSEN